ncbi:hypothetical protein PC122_g9282 [Phytophthora cactorum]|nr:hypothetical protein PC122_g9282 [Phytophthora cactorum]
MSLSGRQQILLSIYGAATESKKKHLKKPQRPNTSSTLVRRASSARRPAPFVRTDSKERQDADEREVKQPIENQPVLAEFTPSPPPREACKISVQAIETPKSATQREGRRRKVATTSERSENVATITKGTRGTATASESAVISLYGDGFLEIPLSKGSEDTQPSRLLGNSGFSITMLLFKAADTEKHKARVEKGGARHTTPELDDTGDFVRWLCCGSTDRNIFGCFTNLDEANIVTRKTGGFSNGFQGPGESTPKLLSAKLHVENSGDDEATFSLYDRGVHLNYREKGEDGGRGSVVLVLHSMNSTGCFPKLEDIKKKVESIVLFEAKRSPREEIQIQAFRHLLAVAGQTRHNRERTFMESVINRKLVLTERKVAAEFEKIGFFFASTELQEVVSYLKRIQDNYSRTHNHRMDDLPSLSMLTPTPTGLYTLPFMNTLLVSSTIMCDNGGPRSPWRFVCVLVDYDFQLVDFVHEGCPVTKRGGISYRQGQSIYNGIVDRLYLRLTALSNKVFCVLFSLQRIAEDESNGTNDDSFTGTNLSGVRVQMENVEEHQVLGMFDAKPHAKSRWFTLTAVYRSKKNNQWKLQAIGGCGNATSIYASIDEVNVLLAELRIIQTYDIRVYFIETGGESENSTPENRECEEFVRRLAKNIRFGRNGRVVLVPTVQNSDKPNKICLRIALKLQEMENEIDVYTHRNSANRSLPTIQSVYRTILRILSQHGIKECLQQNPFAPQNKKVKRHVEFRVVSAQTNASVENVHVFIEKNVSLGSNLAKTMLPTLMMGSRLMSIRRRLHKKRVTEITQEVAKTFVADCIAKASKRATNATNLNVKLISVVRARALLRKVMRQRYEKFKSCIIERARKSEQAREYSQSVPIRLQKLFANSLELSNSERDLLQNSTREELAELELLLRGVPAPIKEKTAMDESFLFEEWKCKKAQFASEDLDNPKNELNSSENQTSSGDSNKPEDTSDGIIKDRRQLLVTDSGGRANCRLVPGSYSLYVFHLDYFEWTSLVAVYPTISASGLSSGPTTATSSVQEIVIPLDVYRWTYALQLVDYFHPHVNIKLAGIPLQITNNCSSERQIVVTDANGCATWDVSKGLYAVDVLRECSCVLYSALKQVVVDGGRYRTSRTIPMPVLFGGVKVTVLVVTATSTHSDLANIKFHAASPIGNITSAATDKRRNARIPLNNDLATKEEPSEGEVSVGSSRAFKVQLGTYRLKVTSDDSFPVSLPVKVTWASSKTQVRDGNRYLAVLSPKISAERTFRVVLSYVDGVETMDVILEAWKDNTMVGHVWRQNSNNCLGHVELENINSLEGLLTPSSADLLVCGDCLPVLGPAFDRRVVLARMFVGY